MTSHISQSPTKLHESNGKLNPTRLHSVDGASVLAIVKLYALDQVSRRDSLPNTNHDSDKTWHFENSPHFPSLAIYLDLLMLRMNCSPFCFVIALLYIDRLRTDCGVRFTSQNAHTLFLTAAVISTKYLDDQFFLNKHYAHLGGLSSSVFNEMERSMLSLLNYSLTFDIDRLEQFFGRICHTVYPPRVDSPLSAKSDSLSDPSTERKHSSSPDTQNLNLSGSPPSSSFSTLSSLNVHSKVFVPASRRLYDNHKRQKLEAQRESFLMAQEDINAISVTPLHITTLPVVFPSVPRAHSRESTHYFYPLPPTLPFSFLRHRSKGSYPQTLSWENNASPPPVSSPNDAEGPLNSFFFANTQSALPPMIHPTPSSSSFPLAHLLQMKGIPPSSSLFPSIQQPSVINPPVHSSISPAFISAPQPTPSPAILVNPNHSHTPTLITLPYSPLPKLSVNRLSPGESELVMDKQQAQPAQLSLGLKRLSSSGLTQPVEGAHSQLEDHKLPAMITLPVNLNSLTANNAEHRNPPQSDSTHTSSLRLSRDHPQQSPGRSNNTPTLRLNQPASTKQHIASETSVGYQRLPEPPLFLDISQTDTTPSKQQSSPSSSISILPFPPLAAVAAPNESKLTPLLTTPSHTPLPSTTPHQVLNIATQSKPKTDALIVPTPSPPTQFAFPASSPPPLLQTPPVTTAILLSPPVRLPQPHAAPLQPQFYSFKRPVQHAVPQTLVASNTFV
ncbi:hypothetical protein BLNAU_23485 [Blattamonas nauphoetae]|uniref:Cyclin n=1 Tax=Blattamonas nauphoetae TaxID=2049346 RepID=A0ABQ9WQJ3_9EUKA|nr:hypothetical protein BLNAU_23485 [Blattamonas nauphoetae]